MMVDDTLIATRWDEEYRSGKYVAEPPLPFVERILLTLKGNESGKGAGLYVGCGNGRNYLPLTEAGIDLYIAFAGVIVTFLGETGSGA